MNNVDWLTVMMVVPLIVALAVQGLTTGDIENIHRADLRQ